MTRRTPCHVTAYRTDSLLPIPFAMTMPKLPLVPNCQPHTPHNEPQFDAVMLSPSSNCGRDWSK